MGTVAFTSWQPQTSPWIKMYRLHNMSGEGVRHGTEGLESFALCDIFINKVRTLFHAGKHYI